MDIIDYAIQNKLTPFISMQNHYSLIYREEEREMFPTLKVRFSSLCTKPINIAVHEGIWRRLHSVVTSWPRSPYPSPLREYYSWKNRLVRPTFWCFEASFIRLPSFLGSYKGSSNAAIIERSVIYFPNQGPHLLTFPQSRGSCQEERS